MDKIVITGVEPYDGEYEIDIGWFTNREYHTIREISGVRAGEMAEAAGAEDQSLVLAVAVVAMQRNGVKGIDVDRLWDAEGGCVSFVADRQAEAADARPPVESSESGTERTDGEPGFDAETMRSSGADSSTTSESPEAGPTDTGSPSSEAPAASVSET